MDAKSQIDVLKITAKRNGERSDSQQHVAPIESAGCAGAEDGARLKISGIQGLAMTTFAGHAPYIIAVARAINFRRPLSILARSKNEWGDGRHSRIVEAGQGRLGPARSHFRVIIEQFDNSPAGSTDAGVGGGAKASTARPAPDLHSGKLPCRRATTAVVGPVVDHDDFRASRRIAKQGIQTGAQQIRPIV